MVAGRLATVVAVLTVPKGSAHAGEAFRHLTSPEIRARLLGKEVTDAVHWAYRFVPSGRTRVVSLGRAPDARWRIEGDGRCLDAPPCVQVWMAGNRVEFRRGDGTLPDESVLQGPAHRP
ncbi:hypothetical protein [Methylobacterium symbioticum]|uniref:Uncharacterized protein n=1 Tax=Methylobacterium symbioticum TaxID=2584084 RepID=A0A509EFB9_9HYPH|nr:hypothetical protein [Methylobacterium symbioticum]VUD72294.1 hypothetical protein MET9862_02889 [Methylobacterium symbioticum]